MNRDRHRGTPARLPHREVRARRPRGASGRRAECIHGAEPEPAPVEQAARDQLLQHVLHIRPVEAEPDGAGNLIPGSGLLLKS